MGCGTISPPPRCPTGPRAPHAARGGGAEPRGRRPPPPQGDPPTPRRPRSPTTRCAQAPFLKPGILSPTVFGLLALNVQFIFPYRVDPHPPQKSGSLPPASSMDSFRSKTRTEWPHDDASRVPLPFLLAEAEGSPLLPPFCAHHPPCNESPPHQPFPPRLPPQRPQPRAQRDPGAAPAERASPPGRDPADRSLTDPLPSTSPTAGPMAPPRRPTAIPLVDAHSDSGLPRARAQARRVTIPPPSSSLILSPQTTPHPHRWGAFADLDRILPSVQRVVFSFSRSVFFCDWL